MRKTVYTCDQCSKIIGDNPHVTMSFGRFSGIAIPPGLSVGIIGDPIWHVAQGLTGQFLHFCTPAHLADYFQKLMDLVLGKKKAGKK